MMVASGDVILVNVQFTDTYEVKKRPALVLFEEFNNIVVAGITSNSKMSGVLLTQKDGAMKDSVIKLNYLFTVSGNMVEKILFTLSDSKKRKVYDALAEKLSPLS
ncbi:MAG: type II toxin-antitoxin system PemK/MazF family toxin [archaeon]